MVDSEVSGSPEEREDAGTVVDPAVLAERRVKRAELAEQAHAQRAAEAEEALGTAEAELHRAQLRLERANEDRARLEAQLGMREHELRTARHRVDAERLQHAEEAEDSGERLHTTEAEAAALRGRLSAAEARVAELEADADRLRLELEAAGGRSDEATEPLVEELGQRVLAADATVARLRQELAEQVTAGQGARAAVEVVRRELEAVREEVRARQAHQLEVPQRLRELGTAAVELRAQVALLEAERRGAQAAARRSDDALVALEAEHLALREETERAADALLQAHGRLAEAHTAAQRARDELDRERARAEAQVAELGRRSEELLARSAAETKDLRAHFETQTAGLQERLEAETAELQARLEAETAELQARLEAQTAELQARLEAERRARIADGERLADARAAGVAAAAEVSQAHATLEAEVKLRDALERQLGDEVAALREDLEQAREHERRREEREREAQRLASELVATASQALSEAEEQIAQAETTVSAFEEEIARERADRERAEAELVSAQEVTVRTVARTKAAVELETERRRRSEGLLAKLGIELARERQAALEHAAATVALPAETPTPELGAEERLAATRRQAPGSTRRESELMRALTPSTQPEAQERAVSEEAHLLDAGPAAELFEADRSAFVSTADVGPEPADESPGTEGGRSEDEARPEVQAPPGPRVEAGRGWLLRAIEATAESDPEAAAALLVAVLPLQSRAVERNVDYDLHLDSSGWWRVVAVPGLVRPLMALASPRSPRSDLLLDTEPATLVRLIAGAKPKRARRHGRLELKGSRRAAKAVVRSLTRLDLDFAIAAREGLWIDPSLVYLALSQAVAPEWTASHSFVVAHEIVGAATGTWYVHVDGPSPLRIAQQPAEPPVATVRCSAHAFLPLLASQPAPRGEKAALRGDLRAIALLREWVARAQTGA